MLLVEDEDPVRSFAARALRLRGYTVVEAASGEEALEILKDADLHVDIMLSDVIMPGLDGPGWVREAQKARPEAKVIFMSGYAEDAFVGGDSGVPGATFLPKPFTLNELTERVKDQLLACRGGFEHAGRAAFGPVGSRPRARCDDGQLDVRRSPV